MSVSKSPPRHMVLTLFRNTTNREHHSLFKGDRSVAPRTNIFVLRRLSLWRATDPSRLRLILSKRFFACGTTICFVPSAHCTSTEIHFCVVDESCIAKSSLRGATNGRTEDLPQSQTCAFDRLMSQCRTSLAASFEGRQVARWPLAAGD